MAALLRVFVDVVAPVFAVVALGALAGPRLGLDVRTLSRAAYYVFVPAFTFAVIAKARVPLDRAARFAGYLLLTHAVFALLGWAVARALRRPRDVQAAYVMLAVFGNVGNYGLALLQFRLGPEALVPATMYYVGSVLLSFVVCVGVAGWVTGGGLAAVGQVFRTPALLAAVPAVAISAAGVELPTAVARAVGLLGDAMIPVMLFVLGLQLAAQRTLRPSADVVAASLLRLLVAPAVAAAAAAIFGLGGIDRATCILQAAMPAAVLVAIIATEYGVAPQFVTATIFYSTLASLPVLTVLLALL